MTQHLAVPIVLVATTSLVALVVMGVFFWKQKKVKKFVRIPPDQQIVPKKWTKVGEVKELVMYPLKGAKRKCLDQAEFTKNGLKEEDEQDKLALHDRLFVAFDDIKHHYLSIKKNTKILFVEMTVLDKYRVKFSFPDTEDLIVQIPYTQPTMTHVEMQCGEIVQTVECGDEAAAWFSQRLLNKPSGVRLGCFVESLVPARTIDGAYEEHAKAYPKLHSEYMGTYHNLSSYMLLSEASVADLNSHITRSPVNPHYFRPNIVIKDSPAYSEDSWDWIRIGDNVVLRGFKYCTRCPIVTVDPETAIRDPKIEPLKTLRSYRQVKEPLQKKVDETRPMMGLYAGCHQTGIARVGDPVYIGVDDF